MIVDEKKNVLEEIIYETHIIVILFKFIIHNLGYVS